MIHKVGGINLLLKDIHCVCLLNISIKVIISLAISIGIIFVILSQLEPTIIWEQVKKSMMNSNNSTYSNNIEKLLKGDSN